MWLLYLALGFTAGFLILSGSFWRFVFRTIRGVYRRIAANIQASIEFKESFDMVRTPSGKLNKTVLRDKETGRFISRDSLDHPHPQWVSKIRYVDTIAEPEAAQASKVVDYSKMSKAELTELLKNSEVRLAR